MYLPDMYRQDELGKSVQIKHVSKIVLTERSCAKWNKNSTSYWNLATDNTRAYFHGYVKIIPGFLREPCPLSPARQSFP